MNLFFSKRAWKKGLVKLRRVKNKDLNTFWSLLGRKVSLFAFEDLTSHHALRAISALHYLARGPRVLSGNGTGRVPPKEKEVKRNRRKHKEPKGRKHEGQVAFRSGNLRCSLSGPFLGWKT